MRKIIFLDIDGPMVPGRGIYMPGQTTPPTLFDPCAVGLLNRMANMSGAKIVVQSSWRKPHVLDRLNSIYPDFSLKDYIIGQSVNAKHFTDDWVCPFTPNTNRWYDIALWLSRNPDVTKYVVLDDDVFIHGHIDPNNLVSVDYNIGLTIDNYFDAMKVLGKKDKDFARVYRSHVTAYTGIKNNS